MKKNHNYFQLNECLATDTCPIIDNEDYYLGLHKNALVPWLILVPKTEEIELFACDPAFKQRIRATVDKLAIFSQNYFNADKMNIATLGNLVSQLHIHIIARKTDDFAFPDPVWGKSQFKTYAAERQQAIIEAIQIAMGHYK